MSIDRRDTSRGPRYDVRLRAPGGGHVKRAFRTKKEAEAWERAQLADRDRGEWRDPSARRRPLRELVASWLAADPGKRPASWARDRSALERHVLPVLGERAIGSITPDDVQAVVNAAVKRGLAPSTVHRLHSTLRAVFNHAVANDVITRSPCRGVKLPELVAARARILSPDELAALADVMPAAYAPMVWLGALLGLRWGEVAGLRVGAVDVLGRTLTVDQAVARDRTGAPLLSAPKSHAGRRTLALPAGLADLLGAHMASLGLDASRPVELLFPAPDGGPMRYSNWLARVWQPAATKAGVGELEEIDERVDGRGRKLTRKRYVGAGFHDLRRTSATELVVAGVDVKTAQHRLGHSTPVLTLQVYAQAVASAERDAAERLEERLMGRRRGSARHGRAIDEGAGAAG